MLGTTRPREDATGSMLLQNAVRDEVRTAKGTKMSGEEISFSLLVPLASWRFVPGWLSCAAC
jgi:hypothetical protein